MSAPASQNPELKFTLTLDDTNTILQALGNMPFQQVYGVIHKIHEQANQQLNRESQGEATAGPISLE